MKNKKVISEINRVREVMGLLNEQTLQMDFHIWETCANGVVVAPVQNMNSQHSAQDWHMEATAFYNAMGSPQPGQVVLFDTTSDVTPAGQDAYNKCLLYAGISSCNAPSQLGSFSPTIHCSNVFGGAHYANYSYISDCANCQDCLNGSCWGGGCTPGVDCWECVTPGTQCQQTTNGTHPNQTACQAACQGGLNDYECVNGQCVVQSGGQFTGQNALSDCQAVCDCANHGVANVNQTTGANPGGFFDPQGANAIAAGNCNPIINKISQGCNPNWSQQKCDCRMDHLNFLLALCQGGGGCNCCPANPLPHQNFITTMTQRWSNSIAQNPSGDGCVGNPANPNSGMCAKFKQFCPSSGPNSVPGGNGNPNNPTHECKCDYLWSTYNCSC